MVSTLSFVAMAVTLVLSLVLPFAILLILRRGRKGVTGVWIAGAIGFFVPQIIIRIPILQVFGRFEGFMNFAENYPYFFVFALALSAALFETAGRLFILKALLSKRLSYMTGLVSGAGHGGIEAVMLVGMTYINNIVISILLNSGRLSSIIPNDSAMAEQLQQALTETSPALFLAGGFERIFAMMFHIAMSVLLTLFIIKKRAAIGFCLVTFLHFALDFIVGVMQVQGASTFTIEAVVFIIAIASLVMTIKIRPRFGDNISIPLDSAEQAVQDGY